MDKKYPAKFLGQLNLDHFIKRNPNFQIDQKSNDSLNFYSIFHPKLQKRIEEVTLGIMSRHSWNFTDKSSGLPF